MLLWPTIGGVIGIVTGTWQDALGVGRNVAESPNMHAHRLSLICLSVATLGQWPGLSHGDTCLPPAEDRPKVALVLGGGGARGVAHIGVIRALEELRIPVDYIAGTSMGALIGGMLATGMTADEIESMATSIDWNDTFRDNVPREERPLRRKRDDELGLYATKIGLGKDSSVLPRAAITGQKVDFLIESTVGFRVRAENFDELPIPFRAVAVDILAAEAVVLDQGNLATAMRASMSLPAIFDPVEDGDRLLVDGGVLMNVPVSVGKEMGADITIAVNVGSPLATKENVRNIVQILYQLTGVVTVVNTREQLGLLQADDFLLTPIIDSKITSGSFAESIAAIPSGYAEAMNNRQRLSGLAISESAWAERRAGIDRCVDGPPVIDFVRIDNRSRFSDAVISRRLTIAPGDILDLDLLEEEIQDIYALGFLQSVQYNLVEDGEQTGLELIVVDDARGTKLIEWGLGIHSTSKVSDFKFRAGFLKTDIGGRAGEFRGLLQFGQALGFLTELWLPVDDGLRYFFLPRVAAEQYRINDFDDDGNKLQQFEVTEIQLDVSIGREFANIGAVSAGFRLGSGKTEIAIGDPNFRGVDFDRREYLLRAVVDTQDSRFFPSRGNRTDVSYIVSDQSLGAAVDFEQFTISSLRAWTTGRHSLQAGFEYDVSFDDVIPLPNLFQAGGFPRLSGFEFNELIGSNFGYVFTGYRYKMLESSFFPGYVGGTIEYGNVADRRQDVFAEGILNGSLYLGFDSILGPIYFGTGFAEGGRQTLFMSLGSIFTRDSLTR